MESTHKTELAKKNNKIQKRLKIIALGAMCIALSMISLDDTVVNIALPRIQYGLKIDVSRLQWVLTANALPAASLVLSTGRLGDIYGHKLIF